MKIGDQVWMAQNLRTTHYADGTAIPVGGNNASYTEPYYYDYSSHSLPLETRGYLYNWPAAMHGAASSNANPSGVQGVCPNGWHLPSDAEWTILTEYVSSQSEYMCDGNSNNIAKALASTKGWVSSTNSCSPGNDPSTNNISGFGAVPVGCVPSVLEYVGVCAYFWSSSEFEDASISNLPCANGFCLECSDPEVCDYLATINFGHSVRCLRD